MNLGFHAPRTALRRRAACPPRFSARRRAALVVLCGAASGCLGQASRPEPILYVLTLPPPATTASSVGGVLAIGEFEGTPALESDHLLVEESPYRVGYYPYHRWTAPPRRLVAEACGIFLARTGLFERVTQTGTEADWILTGYLRHFGQVERDGQWWGHVALALELIASKTRRVVWSHTFERTLAAEGRHPEAVVGALSRALVEVLGDAAGGMRDAHPQGFVDRGEGGT